jgi:Thymidylate synthase
MYVIESDNLNEIQLRLFKMLKKEGFRINVRGSNTVEIHPVILHLSNIRNRCTSLFNRNWNLIFAIGEFAWHLHGSDNLSDIHYYSKNWDSISEDTMHISDSCYGAKIFQQSANWNNLVTELRNDLYSRRAVINLYSSEKTLGQNLKDVACTTSFQFLVRNNKLDLIVTMRSNDVIWGLPNDVFFFTMLQEYLAIILNVEVGEYYHQVGSLHIYDKHLKMMNEVLESNRYTRFTMPEMSEVHLLNQFLEQESQIRTGENIDGMNSTYWDELLNVLKLRSPYVANDEKRQIIQSSAYKEVIEMCSHTYINFF